MKILLALVGAGTGFVLGSVPAAAVIFMLAAQEKTDLRKDWGLVPMVVLVEDAKAGEAVTFDVITSRPFPRKCFTSPEDQLRPDQAALAVNRVLAVPLPRGAILRLSHLAEETDEQDTPAPRIPDAAEQEAEGAAEAP